MSARRALFDRARDRFAAILGVPDVERVECPATVSRDEFGLVLAVHMAALAAVDSHARGLRPPDDPVGISAYLLDRERAYWRRVAGSGRPWVGQDTMARAVFVAVLTGALPYDDAVGALDRAQVSSSRALAADVLASHKTCYPPTDPGTVLAPLYPDRLAEDFLALLVPGHGIDAHVADAWTVTALPRLLTSSQSDIVRSGLTVLVEAARRWPHLVHEQLDPLLRAHPQLVLTAGGAVLAALTDLTELDQGVLAAIEPFLPAGRHVDLDVGSAALVERLTGHRLTESGPATRALLLARLGERLSLAGRFDEAVAMAQEALRIRRALAEVLPEIFRPELARSLLGLGMRFGEMRRWHDALPAVEEALDIYRSLPHPVREELAAAFDAQGACLSELGRDAEALPAAEEAVRIWRELGNPSKLAEVLHNLAIKLGNLGRFDQALAVAREVLDIQRPLARISPHEFQPYVALTLNSASNYLSGLGRHDESLAMAEEAVAIYRGLVDVRPDAFRADLARGLHTLGRALHMLGRVADSLAASREAVDIYREFADAPAFLPALALVLDGFAQDLSDMGHHDEAVAAATEAWTIRHNLPESRPHLAHAATRLSRVLSQAGHHDRALPPAEEAVATCRLLHAADPTTYAPELAEALNALGNRLSAAGRKADAAAVTGEAVSLHRTIGQDAWLAGTLYNLATHLIATDRAAEALAAAEETVALYRMLDAPEHEPKLARVLSELGTFLCKADRLGEAPRVTEQAIEIYRRLAVDEPALYLPHLARSLRNSCTWLAIANRWQEALTAIEESVAITHMLTGAGSEDEVSANLLALARRQVGGRRRNR
ncbi:tetratricopeptide repeat protein [Actinophytocola sp. KF-1]